MGKSTIGFYEELKTVTLQNLLNGLETAQYNTDYIIGEVEKNGDSVYEFENKMVDYEIDISLIRMELNKRLWYGDK